MTDRRTKEQTDRHRQRISSAEPVVEQNVWSPDLSRRQANAADASIFTLVPTQFVVRPILYQDRRKNHWRQNFLNYELYHDKCTEHQFIHLLTATFKDLHIENSKNYKR